MENQHLFSSQNQSVPTSNFYLKVNLSCCAECPRKAKTKLEKLYGVVAITIDKEKGLMGVSGTVDPQIVIQKIAKWGKKAELLSPVKDAKQNSQAKTPFNEKNNNIQDPKTHQVCSSNLNSKLPLQNRKVQKKEKNCYSNLDDSDSSDDHDLDCTNNGNISWRHPDLLLNKIQKPKKPCWFLRLFCKRKSKGQQLRSLGPKKQANNFSRPVYSRMVMPGYGVPSTYYQLPPHGSQYYRPMMHGRMAPAVQPPFSYYQPPPPYGFLGSGRPPPPPPSQFNPMIHYTRYEDNYSHW